MVGAREFEEWTAAPTLTKTAPVGVDSTARNGIAAGVWQIKNYMEDVSRNGKRKTKTRRAGEYPGARR